ncbi:B12-binding domain-containing radical SAM protein [Roseibium sp.]|uniref:B12-binding domain-containing radical SAM protein n=1 Tax=Roseibium sp. TaxID=1936156 RepID=UPI003A97C8AD
MVDGHCRVLLVHPRFNSSSFWNYKATCEMVGAKYPAPPLGLITVASMLPKEWDVRLIDRNAGELTDDDILSADMVMTGGMLPQQADTLWIIRRCRELEVPVVVGGPDPMTSPHIYERANFLVLGEAEGILDKFLEAWQAGDREGRFTAEKFKADVSTTPIPRFDLLTFKDYVQVGVQFSRGCPFTCEFCDIIELYGRVPRTKSSAQMLAELDNLYALGYRGHVDFVDDNLIGNKKAVKAFLPELIAWQKAHNYPFEMSTEASLNLADDKALLTMMQEAGFFTVFVGIESPDPEVLIATRKKQNTRRDIAKSVHQIYDAGITVIAGFIVGFDEESDQVADEITALIEEAAIPVAMTGLLYALPTTQLTRRLQAEGRLHDDFGLDDPDTLDGDQCTAGLNFETKRPRAQILSDFRKVVDRVYAPDAYFGRVKKVASMLNTSGANQALLGAGFGHDLQMFGRLVWSMTFSKHAQRWLFWSTIFWCLTHRPSTLKPVLVMMALYVHLGPFSRFVLTQIDAQIAAVEDGSWEKPGLVAAE